MPCQDWDEPEVKVVRSYVDAERARNAEAMLCGVLRVIEKFDNMEALAREFNEKEAGVTVAELGRWWEKHKKRDDTRNS